MTRRGGKGAGRRTGTKGHSAGHSGRGLTERIKPAKGRKPSSQRWLERQLNDPYVEAAHRAGYRSRAAYKLAELDDRFHILKPGQTVIDLGAAPGGWTQVAVERTKARATAEPPRILAVDVDTMDPVPGAAVLHLDFLADDAPAAVMARLGRAADVVLSDLAPHTTGHAPTDHLKIMALVEAAYDFAVRVLAPGGTFVAKVFQGGTEKDLLARMKSAFKTVRHAKPPASRAESAEIYVVATGFRGAPPER